MFPWWLFSALGGHAAGATVQLADRFLLISVVNDPVRYAFFVGAWNGAVIIGAPFLLSWPGLSVAAFASGSGILFLAGLVPFFASLNARGASVTVPAAGAMNALFTLFLASVFAGDAITPPMLLSFGLLVAGHVVITARAFDAGFMRSVASPDILSASFLFACAAVMSKIAYSAAPLTALSFLNISIWIGIGSGLGALILLIHPAWRTRIFDIKPLARPRNFQIFAASRVAAGASGFLLNLAIALGPVALVQATLGAQYLFVLGGVAAFSRRFPHMLQEDVSGRGLTRKLVAVMLIGSGLAFIAFVNGMP